MVYRVRQGSCSPTIDWALNQNYISETATHWQITQHGKLFLNELLEGFWNNLQKTTKKDRIVMLNYRRFL